MLPQRFSPYRFYEVAGSAPKEPEPMLRNAGNAYLNRRFEPEWLKRYLPPGDTILKVGAKVILSTPSVLNASAFPPVEGRAVPAVAHSALQQGVLTAHFSNYFDWDRLTPFNLVHALRSYIEVVHHYRGSQMLVRLMFGEDATDRKRAALAELADHRFTGKYVDNFTVMPGGVGFEIILRHAQA